MSIHDRYIGKWVICRSVNEGINFGKVVMADETGVVLSEAQRLWSHSPLDKDYSWYEGVSLIGLSSDSRISHAAIEKLICEDYSLTLCDEKCINSIKDHQPNKQS